MVDITSVFSFLWTFFKKQSKMMLIPIIFALVLAIHESLSPYILKIIIDEVSVINTTQEVNWNSIFLYGILYVAFVEIVNLMFRLKDYFKLKVFPTIKADIVLDIFNYLMGHSYNFFLNNYTGSLINRILDITKSMETIFNMMVDVFLWRSLSLLIAAIAMYQVSPFFSLLVLGWSSLFVYITVKLSSRSKELSNIFAKSRSDLIGKVTDSLSNVINIILFQNAKKESENLSSDLDMHMKTEKNMLGYMIRIGFFQGALVTLFTGCMMILLLYTTYNGYTTSGDFAFIIMLSGTLIRNVYSISSDLVQLAD